MCVCVCVCVCVCIFFSNKVEGGGGGLTVSRVSRNRGGFVKCVAIQKKLGIPVLNYAVSI
jgi:hypothetical protein